MLEILSDFMKIVKLLIYDKIRIRGGSYDSETSLYALLYMLFHNKPSFYKLEKQDR